MASRSWMTGLPSFPVTVCGPKLTRRIPSFGINHSPAISWLPISGTSSATVPAALSFVHDAGCADDAQHTESRRAGTTPSFAQPHPAEPVAIMEAAASLVTLDGQHAEDSVQSVAHAGFVAVPARGDFSRTVNVTMNLPLLGGDSS